jgi:hypothetical protein
MAVANSSGSQSFSGSLLPAFSSVAVTGGTGNYPHSNCRSTSELDCVGRRLKPADQFCQYIIFNLDGDDPVGSFYARKPMPNYFRVVVCRAYLTGPPMAPSILAKRQLFLVSRGAIQTRHIPGSLWSPRHCRLLWQCRARHSCRKSASDRSYC